MRRLGSVVVALLISGVLASVGAVAPVAAASPVPKVVFIVGPAGAATSGYRAEARAAATVARRYTPDVTEIYSPNATWPAVKAALQGASLVVYMGHGNGWPSPYRNALYRPTQNGFGLNPSAGGNDSTHQYFGEGRIAASINLAKDAVVLLNHLCYASGNSEPGLPEGTLDQGKQRVDNFAAGFIAAGASAVIAEAYDGPAGYVKAILGGSRSVEAIWRSAPSANHHVFGFESERSPGYVAQMDPKHVSSGFERSIVLREGLASADVLAGARGSATGSSVSGGSPAAVPGPPNLLATSIKLSTPTIKGSTSAGGTSTLRIPFKIKDRKDLPASIQASVRWDPLDVPLVPTDPTGEVLGATATPEASPAPSASPAPTTAPSATAPPVIRVPNEPGEAPTATEAATSSPSPSPEPTLEPLQPAPPPDDLALVTPERVGDVVAPSKLHLGSKYLSVPLVLPTAPGRYRLTITLHDGDGVAYDAATQAVIPDLVVRVTGDPDGAILVAPAVTLTAASEVQLPVRVVNLGKSAWGHGPIIDKRDPDGGDPAAFPTLIGRWLSLADDPTLIPEDARVRLPAGLGPNVAIDRGLDLTVPASPGDYLLLLDVVTPEHGSLTAAGIGPAIVRVTVVP